MVKVRSFIKYSLKRMKREMFLPTPFWGLLINPFYIIRSALNSNIRRFSKELIGGRLVDLGCGSKPYHHYFDVDQYIGVDVEKSGHGHLNEDIDLFYDGISLPFADASVDHVFSSEVFEHIFNLDQILTEISRILKYEGRLLITVPFVWDEHEAPYDYARYTSFGLEHLISQNGFTIIHSVKTATFIETITQITSLYVYQVLLPTNIYLRHFLVPIFVFPINFIGIIVSKILPNRKSFFLNNVILAEKNRN